MVFVAKSQLVTAVREELAQNPVHYGLSIATDGEEEFWSDFEELYELFEPATTRFEPHVAGAIILSCMVKRCRAVRRRSDMASLETSIAHAGSFVFRAMFKVRKEASVFLDRDDNLCVDLLGSRTSDE